LVLHKELKVAISAVFSKYDLNIKILLSLLEGEFSTADMLLSVVFLLRVQQFILL